MRCSRSCIAGLPAILLSLLLPAVSRADAEQDEIQALIGQNASDRALPIAIARARHLASDAPAWQQVLTLAGWNADQASALEALRHLAVLSPENRDTRLALTQRLLAAHATREALAHARWLVAAPRERDPLALEVAMWVLIAEGSRDEAIAVARRWVAAAPGDPHARWALADLTHWSSRWREAREQYYALARMPGEATRVRARVDLLRHDHPTEVHLDGLWWRDNVGVSYEAAALEGNVQLPRRVVLLTRTEVGRWSQSTTPPVPDLGVVITQVRLRFEATNPVWPELAGGFEVDTNGNHSPMALAGLRLSIAGRLFGGVWMQYDRLHVSLLAERQNIREWGPTWSLYFEPMPLVFFSTEGMVQWISDGNLRGRALAVAGMHNPGQWQVEPRAYVQYDAYRELRVNADPYFTPTAPWTVGADIAGRYTLATTVQIEAALGAVLQYGVVAFRPSLRARVELARHLRLTATGGYVGSPQYSQVRFDASIGYLF